MAAALGQPLSPAVAEAEGRMAVLLAAYPALGEEEGEEVQGWVRGRVGRGMACISISVFREGMRMYREMWTCMDEALTPPHSERVPS